MIKSLPFLFQSESPELYYVAGLVFADGHVAKDGVSIAQNTREILDSISLFVGYTAKSYEHIYVLRIGATAVANWFRERFGLPSDKSCKMTWPSIPKNFMGDFVRGYLDGDGYVRCSRMNNGNLRRHVRFICGSGPFIYGLRNALEDRGVSHKPIDYRQLGYGHSYTLSYLSLVDIKLLYNLLYYPQCLCLKWKHDTFLSASHGTGIGRPPKE